MTVRNDDSVWWYDIPPTVHSCLENFEFCKPYPEEENSILLDFEVPISDSGFSEVRSTVIQKWESKDEELFEITSANYLVKSLGKSLPNDFGKNAEAKINRSKSWKTVRSPRVRSPWNYHGGKRLIFIFSSPSKGR